jgi:hypothetical protein
MEHKRPRQLRPRCIGTVRSRTQSQSANQYEKLNGLSAGVLQGDQKVSVQLMITMESSGAQRLFNHPVLGLS